MKTKSPKSLATRAAKRLAVACMAVAMLAGPVLIPGAAHASILLIQENFDGDSTGLNGKTASSWNADLTAAGGSSTWVASSDFRRDGSVAGVQSNTTSAHLNLGSYINDAKGTADGIFQLTATIFDGISGNNPWLSLGFSALNSPSTGGRFTTEQGLGTIAYRGTGVLSMWPGPGTANGADVPDTLAQTGARTLTVTLDLTGYDGLTNFGTVTWFDSVLGQIGAYDYTEANDFGSILISKNATGGSYSNLTLTQIPEPSTALLLGLVGGFALLRRRR